MPEFWVEVNIKPRNTSVNDLLLTTVKPTIDQLTGQYLTWHFLREPAIRFRIRTETEARIATIKTTIDAVLNPLVGNSVESFFYGNHGTPETPTNKYQGEEVDYGTKGWQIIQKLMEHTSIAALEMIVKQPLEADASFYAERSIHLFLNQIGYTRYDEASLHNAWSVGNLLIVYGVTQNINELSTLKGKYYARFPDDKPI